MRWSRQPEPNRGERRSAKYLEHLEHGPGSYASTTNSVETRYDLTDPSWKLPQIPQDS